ncbi:MAG TPA: cytochrome c1 [Gammaproteobacteria bacterium]|jgi:ubiquinol-cytochrome c reductase cytochrome c1 subunit|nr:cytochrome c1 [Gammaproteobacteria bacterium]
MKKLICIAVLALSPALASAEGAGMLKADVNLNNTASLQRGAKYFANYCMGCHSAQYVRYNRLGQDLGLNDAQLETYLMPAGAKPSDTMQSAMPAEDSEKWFGRTPPDLSLAARSRGTDWIYSYLKSFYVDPRSATGANNLVLPNAAMPNVLWELQGLQKPVFKSEGEGGPQVFDHFEQVSQGKLSPEQFDQVAMDITNFLSYVAEPVQLERRDLGLKVIGFLIVFLLFAVMLKREIWKDVH